MQQIGVILQAANPMAWSRILEKPVLWYSCAVFLAIPETAHITILTSPVYQEQAVALSRVFPLGCITPLIQHPGSTLDKIQAAAPWNNEYADVCIHDGTWLLSAPAQMNRMLSMLDHHQIVVAGVPLKETLKETDEQCMIRQTPDRAKLWKIQSPMCIRRSVYDSLDLQLGAEKRIREYLQVFAAMGEQVTVVAGEYANIEITAPATCYAAEEIAAKIQKNSPFDPH